MKTLICLMGPTATGKSNSAIQLANYFETEIISVDSAMVYRGMDIGTAKPTLSERNEITHHLIDICDPKDAYSAGHFIQDVTNSIQLILAKNKLPILVGGTMLYFKLLQQGLAKLPPANLIIRDELTQQLIAAGSQSLHDQLEKIDPHSANRIHPHDAKRIIRALEVYLSTGKTFSEALENKSGFEKNFECLNIAFAPDNRAILHQLIEDRFKTMLDAGLVDEVKALYDRGDLSETLPSMQSVNYRQVWGHLSGQYDFKTMCEKATAATRQLAKRQFTWLKRWPEVTWFTSFANIEIVIDKILKAINRS